jgi:hypothetical protein
VYLVAQNRERDFFRPKPERRGWGMRANRQPQSIKLRT